MQKDPGGGRCARTVRATAAAVGGCPRGLQGADRTVWATAAAGRPGAVRGAWGGHGLGDGWGYVYIYIYMVIHVKLSNIYIYMYMILLSQKIPQYLVKHY